MEKITKKDLIINNLKPLGLSDIETQLYLKLLEIGPATITDLSSRSNIPRTTVFENVARLIGKGLITQSIKNSRKLIIAENPSKIRRLLSDRQSQLGEELNNLNNMQSTLDNVIVSIFDSISNIEKHDDISVKYYEGIKGFRDVCERSIITSSKEILFISNMDEWKKVFTDKYAYEYYVPERMKKKLFAKTLAMRTKKATEIKDADKEFLREMRFLPDTFNFDPTIIITDSEVSIMTSSKPYTATLIQNPLISKLFKDIFYDMWEHAA